MPKTLDPLEFASLPNGTVFEVLSHDISTGGLWEKAETIYETGSGDAVAINARPILPMDWGEGFDIRTGEICHVDFSPNFQYLVYSQDDVAQVAQRLNTLAGRPDVNLHASRSLGSHTESP